MSEQRKIRVGIAAALSVCRGATLGATALGVSILGGSILGGAAIAAEPETTAPPSSLEEIVVTGTSIRGVAPVGANLITVDRAAIESSGAQTLQEIMKSVPAVTGFGTVAQGAFGSADGAGTFAPTIHGLGASASNGTLVLIDGHRLPLTGINHTLADPNVISPLAIERVEVLPDGASSTYGSDAVAGVLNFITRRNFQGFDTSLQAGYADGYDTRSAGFIWGDRWENGGLMFTYNYSDRSNLLRGDRPYTLTDQRAKGGGNFSGTTCSPAAVSPIAGQPFAGQVFAYPYAAGATSVLCDYTGSIDLIPSDVRHSALVKLDRNITDNLRFTTDLVYSKETNEQVVARGSVTTRAFGAGSTAAAGQINPFFTGPTGVNTEEVRFAADDLFGPGAVQKGGAESAFATSTLEYQIGGDWRGVLGATFGKDDSSLRSDGTLCTSCANLALNGTTNATGSTTQPSVPGTTTAVVALPLTAANALDVWSPAASNRTSAAVRAQLLDNTSISLAHQTLRDLTLKFDGSLFHMPGGAVRAAIGAEYIEYAMNQEITRPRNTGPASSNSTTTFLKYDRDVKSGFVEVLVPLVGADNGIPLVRKLDLNASGRYDEYSDFGSTRNPRFAITWGVLDGLTVRGNIARSFVAPALTSRGNALGVTGESNYGNFGFANTVVPATFPGIAQLQALGLAGCTAGSPTCTIGSGSVTGFQINGGNKDLKPEIGKTYSFGVDIAPAALPGLRASATYWHAKYEGGITAPQPAFAIAATGLNSLLTIYPNGATAAEIAAATAGLPQNAPLPATTYFIYSFRQRNAFDLTAAGVDADISYSFDTGIGKFDAGVSVSRKTNMDQRFGSDGVEFSVLNSVGLNTTFPSNKMAGRANIGWAFEGWTASAFLNYSGAYTNWGNTAATGNPAWNIVRQNGLYPVGGGQPVDSFSTVDLQLGYKFTSEGWLSGTRLTLEAINVFDKDPPFFNAAVGYDTFNANPLGRIVTLGLSKKW
jgi:iron complex outermembrane receptor protein